MLPTEDAAWVGAELARRFGLPLWSFTLTATDANRWAIRLARLVTGRPKILRLRLLLPRQRRRDVRRARAGRRRRRPRRQRRRAGRPSRDHAGRRVQRPRRRSSASSRTATSPRAHGAGAHQHRHRAAGAGLPGRRCASCATTHGTLLIIDETHTFSAGPGGARTPGASSRTSSRSASRSAAGIPIGAYGVIRRRSPSAMLADQEADLVDVGGVGGTLAGNALSRGRGARDAGARADRRRRSSG